MISLYGHPPIASPGEIGQVQDFYFDDKIWVLRYRVADTGSWLSGRLVLLSPHVFGRFDSAGKSRPINLSRPPIETGPSTESHPPVSRPDAIDRYRYYGWPACWNGGAMWGLGGYPVILPPGNDESEAQLWPRQSDEEQLPNGRGLAGYEVQTTDGIIGHISGLIANDRSWAIAEDALETRQWQAGKEILIFPGQIERLSYEDSQVVMSRTQAEIRRTEVRRVPMGSA